MDDERAADQGTSDALADLGQKLDTVAGAVAAIAASHTDLLGHVAEAEARRAQDAHEVAQRLDALERQVLALPTSALAPAASDADPVDLEQLRADIALSLEVVARLAEAVDRLDSRTEDRLAAVRDAAASPVDDLQAVLAARNERHDAQLGELRASIEALAAEGPAQVRERLDELAAAVERLLARPGAPGNAEHATVEQLEEVQTAVRALTLQLPELAEGMEAVLEHLDRIDLAGSLAQASAELGGRLTLHTDTALAGVLRIIDERLVAMREVMRTAGDGPTREVGGFEAGAVMGAAQAAWNRLEQRLDTEFDDLGRQLQAMAAMIDQAAASADAAATRPVVSGEQLRKAASAVKDSVVSASKSRRERRGGPRGLGRGS